MLADVDVSVIIPVHNGEAWLDECLQAVVSQSARDTLTMEISVFDDGSTDGTRGLLSVWEGRCQPLRNLMLTVTGGGGGPPKGVGFAKNRAVEQSCGHILCFQDVDDIMKPDRVLRQFMAAKEHPDAIVGCQFERRPRGSTVRFTRWANTLRQDQLCTQVYTSHGPTIIMPTWCCSRRVFNRVGGFSEAGRGTPEDLLFFYHHLDAGGGVYRVDEDLLVYRYHPEATTFTIDERVIWDIRLRRLQDKVLSHWTSFVIWNAGKQGRRLYRSLDAESRGKVTAFCDVDGKKVGRDYVPYDKGKALCQKIPIVHFTQAHPPFVVCIKLDLTGGAFECNLASLQLVEGRDYVLFS